MKKLIVLISIVVQLVGLQVIANAAPYTANFAGLVGGPTPAHSAVAIDAGMSAILNTTYGITVNNSYLYYDTRDPFDAIGIANNIGSSQPGEILFSDTTNFVTLEWASLVNHINLDFYNANNVLLGSTSIAGNSGSYTFSGTGIASLTFKDGGGQVGISALSYDYDGVTDGTNNDTTPVPEPSTMLLLGGGLAGLAFWRKKKQS
jgi:hypothetical protein